MFLYDPYDAIAERQLQDELIEDEMHRHKEQTIKNISSVVHFETETFLKILAYSFYEGFSDAETLAHKLNLREIDFCAILENFDAFSEYYLKDQDSIKEQAIALHYDLI